MVALQGTYTSAVIYTQRKEKAVMDQMRRLCSQPCMEGQQIRVMPDVHLCNGVCVGVTVTCGKLVIPSLLGRDIGCGVLTAKLEHCNAKNAPIDYEKLDRLLHWSQRATGVEAWVPELYADRSAQMYAVRDFGTLGSGNHFVELDVSADGTYYMMIHSGSRGVGRAVADYYQYVAKQELSFYDQHHRPKSLAPLSAERSKQYLEDVAQVQNYASRNRSAMLDYICREMGWNIAESFETVHNYYDAELHMLRKGAVSARKGEQLVIPLNMRDGVLLCRGKGNDAWNQSAPHGSGRLMSRTEAKSSLQLQAYQSSMQGIYTTSVCAETLDEAPACYKPSEEIVNAIGETVAVLDWLKPVYNYKNKN